MRKPRPQPIELTEEELTALDEAAAREEAEEVEAQRADRGEISLRGSSPRAYRRHEIIAALDAIGWPRARIARFLGISPAVVSGLRRDPAYAAACDALARRAQSKIVEGSFDVAAAISADQERNFGFLRKVRDDTEEKTENRLRVALELFDRQAPKPRQREADSEPIVRINFDLREIREMDEALKSAGVIDVSVARPDAAPEPTDASSRD
jgi:hypothetical protein